MRIEGTQGSQGTQVKSSNRKCSVNKVVVKYFAIFANFAGNHLCWYLFLIKLQVFGPATSLKVFSCEYCEIFKNVYFQEHLQSCRRLLLSRLIFKREPFLKLVNIPIKLTFSVPFNLVLRIFFKCKLLISPPWKLRKNFSNINYMLKMLIRNYIAYLSNFSWLSNRYSRDRSRTSEIFPVEFLVAVVNTDFYWLLSFRALS